MASVHDYKRLENKLIHKIKNAAISAGVFIGGVFKAIGRFLSRRYTLVFVPHSEKKVYNLHVTILSIICFFFVLFGIIGTFFWYGASYSSTMYAMASNDVRYQNVQASLDQLRDETALLLREARNFEGALSGVLSAWVKM